MEGGTFPAMLCSTRSHFVARLIFPPGANGRGLCCGRQTPPDVVRRGRVKKTPYHAWPKPHRHNLPLLPHPCSVITMLKVTYFSENQGSLYSRMACRCPLSCKSCNLSAEACNEHVWWRLAWTALISYRSSHPKSNHYALGVYVGHVADVSQTRKPETVAIKLATLPCHHHFSSENKYFGHVANHMK